MNYRFFLVLGIQLTSACTIIYMVEPKFPRPGEIALFCPTVSASAFYSPTLPPLMVLDPRRIRDDKNSEPGSAMKKVGSEITNKDQQQCYTVLYVLI